MVLDRFFMNISDSHESICRIWLFLTKWDFCLIAIETSICRNIRRAYVPNSIFADIDSYCLYTLKMNLLSPKALIRLSPLMIVFCRILLKPWEIWLFLSRWYFCTIATIETSANVLRSTFKRFQWNAICAIEVSTNFLRSTFKRS